MEAQCFSVCEPFEEVGARLKQGWVNAPLPLNAPPGGNSVLTEQLASFAVKASELVVGGCCLKVGM